MMKTAPFFRMSAALPIAAMLALAGCGGGGSSKTAGVPVAPAGGEPMDPPKMRELPALATGLTAGDVAPLHPTSPDVFRAAMLADPSNTFRAYSASIIRNFGDHTVTVSSRHSIQSVASDGNYGFHITYGDTEADEPVRVHFPQSSFRAEITSYAVPRSGDDPEDLGYWLWAYSSVPFNGKNYGSTDDGVLAALGSSFHGGGRVMAVYGLETPAASLPTGTATYSGGSAFIESWDNNLGDVNTNTGRTRLRGDVRLAMDFAGGSLTGRIDGMTRRLPGEDSYSALSATTGFDITNGGIADDGQFAATITGTDANASALLADSMRGFEGGLVGAIYGDDAHAAGGVFAVQRKMDSDDRVMTGYLWGLKEE